VTSTGVPGLFDIIDRQTKVNRNQENTIRNQRITILELSAKVDRSRFWMIVSMVGWGLFGITVLIIKGLI